MWGAHSSKVGFYFQHSFKPQSIFASFNSQIDFTDNSSNPFDTGFSYANAATGVFNFYQQASKYALPEWRYKNIEWYAQDNWKPNEPAHARLRRAVLRRDAAVGHDAAGLEFPARRVRSERGGEALSRRCASAARRARAACGAGWIRRSIAQGVAPTLANTVEERFIGRLTPGSNRFNGAFQAGQGIDDAAPVRQRRSGCRRASARCTT